MLAKPKANAITTSMPTRPAADQAMETIFKRNGRRTYEGASLDLLTGFANTITHYGRRAGATARQPDRHVRAIDLPTYCPHRRFLRKPIEPSKLLLIYLVSAEGLEPSTP